MGESDDQATIRAGGALLWRQAADGLEVAVIHRPRYDDWTFPKGKLKNGEHLLRGVIREVAEETGITPVLGQRLEAQRYLKDGRLKRVDYWAAQAAAAGNFAANDEVDRIEWLPLPDAERRLSYERDADLLAEFAARPVRTTPYIILRHASAGAGREWPGADNLRPLDAKGREQAGDLAGLLSVFGRARVISSATARCLETVLPYVARTGAELRTDQIFTVGTAAADRASETFLWMLTEPAPVIICTHGELIPGLVSAACRKLGAEEPDDPELRKATFWVFHVADGALAAMERHESPARW